jgi:hypothetical protein
MNIKILDKKTEYFFFLLIFSATLLEVKIFKTEIEIRR